MGEYRDGLSEMMIAIAAENTAFWPSTLTI
jgi:hypothetical protein